MTSRVCRAARWFLSGVQKSRDAGRLRRVPALAVVDAPGVDHDDRRLGGAQAVGHLDDAAGVVARTARRGRAGRRPSSSTSTGASKRVSSRTGSTNSGWSASSGFGFVDRRQAVLVDARRVGGRRARRDGRRQRSRRSSGEDGRMRSWSIPVGSWCVCSAGRRTGRAAPAASAPCSRPSGISDTGDSSSVSILVARDA